MNHIEPQSSRKAVGVNIFLPPEQLSAVDLIAANKGELSRKHLEERDREAIAGMLLAEMDELEDGRLFMENLDIERSLRR